MSQGQAATRRLIVSTAVYRLLGALLIAPPHTHPPTRKTQPHVTHTLPSVAVAMSSQVPRTSPAPKPEPKQIKVEVVEAVGPAAGDAGAPLGAAGSCADAPAAKL
jgi:hypothetical protein